MKRALVCILAIWFAAIIHAQTYPYEIKAHVIPGVPSNQTDQNTQTGYCAPAAASNVLNYLGNTVGYDGLTGDLINMLAGFMGTGVNGTNIENISTGISELVNTQLGYGFTCGMVDGSRAQPENTFYTIEYEINHNRPLIMTVVNHNFFDGRSHAVTVVGYRVKQMSATNVDTDVCVNGTAGFGQTYHWMNFIPTTRIPAQGGEPVPSSEQRLAAHYVIPSPISYTITRKLMNDHLDIQESGYWRPVETLQASADGEYYYAPADELYYFCSWDDGTPNQHDIVPQYMHANNYSAYYKLRTVLQGYYDGMYVHLSWDWLPADRPPYFTKFELYKAGSESPIYIGTANSYADRVGEINGLYAGLYTIRAYVYGATDGFITGISIKVAGTVTGDPVVQQSSDPMATAYSNGHKIAIDQSGKLHVTYVSGDTVYYTYSTDDGNRWSTPKAVGMGKNPAIQLKHDIAGKCGHNNNSETPSICYVSGNALYNSEQAGSAWSSPQCIYQGQADEEISYLSYVINQANSQSYVGWVSTTPGGSQVSVSPYSPGSSQGQLSPTPIDQGGGTTLFKSPSMVIGKTGNLITSWSNNGVVKYNDSNGVIELSESGKNCIHPIVTTYGDKTSVVWMEQINDGSKMETGKYQIVRRDKTPAGWTSERVISCPDGGDAQFPVAAAKGQYVFTKDNGNGDYDINYVGEYSDGQEMTTQNISHYSGGNSGYPDVIFSESWPKHKLYIVWTEADTGHTPKAIISHANVKVYVMSIDPVPSFEINPNVDQASPYTTQRMGAFCYGSGLYQTVDYDSSKLIYHFDNLDPNKIYQVKAVYYRDATSQGECGNQNKKWREVLKAGNTELANTEVPETTAVKELQLIPKHCYQDGQVNISIVCKKGDYAMCAQLSVIEYADDKHFAKDALAPEQDIITPLSYCDELSQNTPNPTTGRTQFRYQLANAGRTTFKVYNTLGQVVKTLVDQMQQPGSYSVAWDGRDDRGKAITTGIYFYRLDAGTFTTTKKLVMIR